MANTLTLKLTGDYLYPPEIIEADVAMMDRVNLDITLQNDSRPINLSGYHVYIGCTDVRGTVLFDATVEAAEAGKVSSTVQPRCPGQLFMKATVCSDDGDGDYSIALGTLSVATEDRRGWVTAVSSLTQKLLDAWQESVSATENAVEATEATREATTEVQEAIAMAKDAANSVESALVRDNAVYESMVTATGEAVVATQNAIEATSRANSASVTAENATITAQQVTEQAQQAIADANEAASTIEAAVGQAQTAVSQAQNAVTRAEQAIADVESASEMATQASEKATQAEQTAEQAASLAENAVQNANRAANGADLAADEANAAAQLANAKAEEARVSAESADVAREKLPETVKISGAVVSAVTAFTGKILDINTTSVDGSKVVGQVASAHASDSATKALQDGNGNNIVDTYLTQTTAADTYATKAEDSAKLPLSGGTMTGTIYFGPTLGVVSSAPSGVDAYCAVSENTSTGNKIAFGIGASGTNRGIWDSKNNKWLLYANDLNNIYSYDKQVECAEIGISGILRLSDGTQIVYGETSVTANQSASGALRPWQGSKNFTFTYPFLTGTWPRAFVKTNQHPNYWLASDTACTPTTLTCTLCGDSNTTKDVQFLVIGRWK